MHRTTRFVLLSMILFLVSCESPGNIGISPTPLTVDAAPNSTEEAQAVSEPIPLPNEPMILVLFGSDQRPDKSYYLTDVIMLIILKPDGSVSLVSFPRDLRVLIPSVGMNRINAAMENGGFDLFQSTMTLNFGITPQAYILTNFNGFRSIVDSLGGIDVNVSKVLKAARPGYTDGYTVNPGIVHMDGEMALWYVRSRMSTSDIDRLRRAQEVLLGISKKLFTLNALGRIPELYLAYRSSVVTDMSMDDVLQLLPLLRKLDANRVQRYAITFDQTTAWIEPGSGRYFLLPDKDAIRKILVQAVGP